jgi:hypothetical protein
MAEKCGGAGGNHALGRKVSSYLWQEALGGGAPVPSPLGKSPEKSPSDLRGGGTNPLMVAAEPPPDPGVGGPGGVGEAGPTRMGEATSPKFESAQEVNVAETGDAVPSLLEHLLVAGFVGFPRHGVRGNGAKVKKSLRDKNRRRF